MKTNILLSLILAGSVNSAYAADATTQSTTTSTVNTADVQKKDETKKDIDEEITNARMRATLGSKSKFSFKSALSYSGGSLEKPADRIRPNYRSGANRPALTAMGGSIGVNYRMTERDSLSFGTGISIQNPFHGDLSEAKFADPRGGETVQRVEVSTPYVEYSRAYKVGGMQMISGVSYAHYTTQDATSSTVGANALGNLSLDQTILADLGESNWSGGVSLSFDTSFYKGGLSQFMKDEGARQDDFGYGIFPFAEYAFNDKFSFRTVFGYFQMIHYNDQKGANRSAVTALRPYQSMGIGMAVTRDIYLYPNVQFLPLDMRSDLTNVGLSANLNLF